MTKLGRTALITGASAGIGAALARVFAENGFDVVLVARRLERLQALAAEIEHAHGVSAEPIAVDLAEVDSAKRLFETLAERRIAVDALVNNAGFAVPGYFSEPEWPRHADFLQVMITSTVQLTHLAERGMVARGYGRILNVASVAGLIPGAPKTTLYGPAKAFLIKFSEALALEHKTDGLHVTALCPGYTLTEFHDVLGTRARMNRLPKFIWLDAETVAREGFDAVMRGDPVCINGNLYRAVASAVKVLPSSVTRALLSRYSRSVRQHA
jgi:short-subunit dehydrogenase